MNQALNLILTTVLRKNYSYRKLNIIKNLIYFIMVLSNFNNIYIKICIAVLKNIDQYILL